MVFVKKVLFSSLSNFTQFLTSFVKQSRVDHKSETKLIMHFTYFTQIDMFLFVVGIQ